VRNREAPALRDRARITRPWRLDTSPARQRSFSPSRCCIDHQTTRRSGRLAQRKPDHTPLDHFGVKRFQQGFWGIRRLKAGRWGPDRLIDLTEQVAGPFDFESPATSGRALGREAKASGRSDS